MMLTETLGRPLTADELAPKVGLSPNHLRRYAESFGGIRIGSRVVFFENRVIEVVKNAIPQGKEMDGPRPESGRDTDTAMRYEGGSPLRRGRHARGSLDRSQEDRHGLSVV